MITKKKSRILFGIITKSHTELAMDEMNGLRDLGYTCDGFEYGANKKINSTLGRLIIVLWNALRLLVKCYQFKPDFIYLNSRLEYVACTRDFLTIRIIRTLYFRKVTFTLKSHGSDLEVLLTTRFLYRKFIFPYLIKHIKGWLFLSTEELEWVYTRKLIKKERLFLVKNIVRVEKFKRDPDFKHKMNISQDNAVLLYVGRLIEEKGIHDVLKAYVKIREEHKTSLIIVGDGEEFTKVKETIKVLNLTKDVILTGWVDETTAAFYTSNSDMLIFPTYFPEGFPMVVFNSLAAGLAIVTTPTRAAIDYLADPENCLWVESKNHVSIENAVLRLLSDPASMEQMQLNNVEKAQLFTKKVVAYEMAAIIEAIRTHQYQNDFMSVKNHLEPDLHHFENMHK